MSRTSTNAQKLFMMVNGSEVCVTALAGLNGQMDRSIRASGASTSRVTKGSSSTVTGIFTKEAGKAEIDQDMVC